MRTTGVPVSPESERLKTMGFFMWENCGITHLNPEAGLDLTCLTVSDIVQHDDGSHRNTLSSSSSRSEHALLCHGQVAENLVRSLDAAQVR